MDPLAHALNGLFVAESHGKTTAVIAPSSKLSRQTLDILKTHKYIESADFTPDNLGSKITVKLAGRINKCGAVRPRISVRNDDWEKWEQRYLPARGVGLLIVSTSQGLMTHDEAKDKKIGGRLIAYCY